MPLKSLLKTLMKSLLLLLKRFYKGLLIEKLLLVRCQKSSLLLRLLLKDWLNKRLEAWRSYVGINPITLEPLFIKKDADTRTASIVESNSISGGKSGVKLSDLGGKFAAAVIPFLGTLRQGRMAHYKRIVTGSDPFPIGPDKQKSRTADSISIARQLLRGLPIQLTLYTGYSPTSGPPDRLVTKNIQHVSHRLSRYCVAREEMRRQGLPKDYLYTSVAFLEAPTRSIFCSNAVCIAASLSQHPFLHLHQMHLGGALLAVMAHILLQPIDL